MNQLFQRVFILILLPVAFFTFNSCVTESSKSRGSLSDAMDKARDDYEEEREVPSEDKEKEWWEEEREEREEREEDAEDNERQQSAGRSEDLGPVYLAGRGGNAYYSHPYFDSIYDAEILLGYGEGHAEFLLYGGYKAVSAKEGSRIAESIDDGVIFLRGGLEARYYLLPDLPVFSPYLLAQAGGLYMYWSFKNPIEAGAETITSDSVGGLMLGAGAGLQLVRLPSVRLGLSCIPEIYLFYSETQEGFDNDVFDSYRTVRWTVELGFLIE